MNPMQSPAVVAAQHNYDEALIRSREVDADLRSTREAQDIARNALKARYALFLAAVVAVLAEVEEGLDFGAAERDADEEGLGLCFGKQEYRAALDQQHRARVGAVKAQLAQSEARVRELERVLEAIELHPGQLQETLDRLKEAL